MRAWALLCVLVLGSIASAHAAYINRYTTTTNGAITFTGNTLGLNKATGANAPGGAGSIGTFITTTNPTSQDGTFPLGTTANYLENSSSAVLVIPAGSTVLYAELIWGGSSNISGENVTAALNNPVTFITPLGTNTVSPVAATAQAGTATRYVRSANVTTLVQAAGAGTYTVGRVPATQSTADDNNNTAGWTLAVAYRNDALPARNLTIFVGAEAGGAAAASVTGFCTPPTGLRSGRLFVSALEGDSGIVGDSMRFGPTAATVAALSGPNNLIGNFFASQVNIARDTTTATIDTTGTFGASNQTPGAGGVGRQGYDIANVDISATLVNSQTTGFAQGTTTGDQYTINALGIQINVGAPIFPVAVKNVDRAIARVGDILTYAVTLSNTTGTADASNVTFTDNVPPGTSFVANSLTVDGVVQSGANPASGVNIGTIAAGATRTVTLQAQVNSIPASPASAVYANSASWAYQYVPCAGQPIVSGNLTTNPVTTNIARLSLSKSVSPSGSVFAGQTLTYTITAVNDGSANSAGSTLTDAIPSGTTYVAGTTTLNGVAIADVAGTMPFAAARLINSPGQVAGQVNVGAAATVSFQVQVSAVAISPVSNTATADVDGTGGALGVNATVSSSLLVLQADMRAAAGGFPASAIAGSTVSGVVSCTNAGPSVATAATCAVTGAPPGASISCSPPPPTALAVGAAITCNVSYTAPASGSVAVTGSAGSSTSDPTPGNNGSTATTAITAQADMQAATSGFPSNPPAGSTVTGSIICTNAGPSVAAAADCAVSGLPPGATVTCTPTPPVASLAVGAAISCAVSYAAPASGGVTLTGTASSSTADPNSSNNTAQNTQGVVPQADLSAAVTAPGSVNAGQSITVSGTCTNTGPSPAAGASCALGGLPPGATQTCVPSPAPDPLALGSSITCTSTFIAPASGSLNVTATAGTTTADPVAANNSASQAIVITPQADMQAAVSGFAGNPPAGSTATGTVTCSNAGPSVAANATCAVSGLPAGATVTCTPATPVASLAAGASISCAVSYTVRPTGAITATGTAGSGTADPNTGNNTASASQTVSQRADMQSATSAPASAVAGDSVTVSGTCTNAGPSPAAAPTCALSGLPAGATQSCTPSPAPDPLAAGASITCTSTFVAPANLGPSGTLNITTTAGTSTTDPVTANNTDTDPISVSPRADMQAATSGFPTTAAAGSTITGTVVCTNTGPSPAADATCTVGTVPSGGTVTCTPAPAPNPLPVGGQISCAVSYVVPASGAVTVTGTAGSATTDPVPANNTAQANVGAVPQADMQAALSAPGTVAAGQSVTVTGTCTNAGPSDAVAATCALSGLPAGATQTCTPSPVPDPLTVGAAITCTSTFIAPDAGALTVTATAGTATADPVTANNSESQTVTITPQADMAAALSGFPSNPPAGSTVSGTLTCTNNGPSVAADATCVPSGLPAGATVTCSPPSPASSLSVGQAISCAISYTAPSSGSVTIVGTAGSSTADPVPANNVVNRVVGVTEQADMRANTTVPTGVVAGQSVTVSGTCTNDGPSLAAAPTCALSGLPAGATQSCTPSPVPSPLPVGSSITCTSTFIAPANLGAGGGLNIATTAGTSTADPLPGNNTDIEPLAITPQSDMVAVATGFPTNPPAGSSAGGTITCTNNGPSPATNASCGVTSTPPGAVAVCTPNPAPNPLGVGASITCNVSYTVPASGAITVTGTASSNTPDPNTSNNTAQAATTASPRADMQATVTAPATVNAGQTVNVSGTCTNAGPSTAASATCALSGLPLGTTQVCSPNPPPNPLPVGGTISCTASFTAPASGLLSITTTAGSSTADDLTTNNTATTPVTVTPQADMQAVLSGIAATATAGSTVNATATCTNAGPSSAVNATCAVAGLPAGASVSCSPSTPVASLAAGSAITCAISYTVPPTGALTVSATAGSATADPVPANNGATAPQSVVPQADMQAQTTVPGSVAAGQSVTVSGVCTNNGPSPAAAPTCALSGLPAGATQSCTPNPAPNPLSVGGSITCTSTFLAPANLGAGGSLNITTTAGTSTADPQSNNNTDTEPLAITPQADMQAAVSGFPASANAGDAITGTVTCTNAGPSPAVAASCTVGTLPAGGAVSCNPAPVPNPLPVGGQISCTLSYVVPASGGVTVTGTAASSTTDPNATNNTAQALVGTVPQADMRATVTVPATANADQSVTVTGVCTNAGPSDAQAATCALSGLPVGASQSCSPSAVPEPFAVGQTITCTSTFVAPADLGPGGALNITVTAGTVTADPVAANNSDTESIAITPQADMRAAVSGLPTNPPAGSTVSGTVTCTNFGPSVAADASCVPSGLPPGATVVCSPSSPVASLGVGSSISCAVSYPAPATGTVTVTGTAGSSTADPEPTNNTANQAVGVTEQADMRAQTTVPTGVVAGQSVTVSGVCTNAGPSAAAAPTCTLSGLPAGATQSCTPSPAPSPLPVGSSITCSSTFNAPANLGAGGALNITTTAGSSTADPAPGNNIDTDPLVITPQADMTAVASGFPSNPPAGSTATGTVTCTNNGPSPAVNPTCAATSVPSGASAICTPNPAPNPLPVGGQISCAVSYPVPPGGAITITGTAGSSTPDPDPSNNTDQAATTASPRADMQATVSAPATVNAGQPVNVSGVCTNAGPSAAANPTCALSGLPPGTPQTCTPAPVPNPLPVGGVGGTITCSATFTAPASGSLSIPNTAGSSTADPTPGNNSVSAPVAIIPQADMAASVSGFPSNPSAGSTASGTVSCTNNGPSSAANATCAVTGLPAGATVSCSPATPAANLAVGQTITCAVSYPVPASGTVTVTGTAGSSTADPVAANNSANSSQTVVPQADMRAQTTVPAAATAGQSVTVNGTCTNAGPSAAAAPTCALSGLPAGATQSCTPSPAPNPLAVGSSITCSSTFVAPANLGVGGALNITTTAGTSTADPVAANNINSEPLPITPQADMQAAASGFPLSPPAGSTATGTVTCTNNGPSPAPNASCNVTVVPAGGSVTCAPNPAPNPLPAGASITCTVSYPVPASGSVTVTGVADSDLADPSPGNNTSQAATTVSPRADMQATVSAPATVNAGQSVTVSGTCTNAGPSSAQSANCVLSGLPAGATQSCTPSSVPDPLAVGGTITCTSTFTAPASGTLTVSTTAGSLTADDLPANNTAQVPITIVDQADMRAAVSGFPTNPSAGSTVSGTVTCTNAGPSLAATASCAVTGAPPGATITCSPSTPTTAPLGVGQSISCAVSYTAPAGGGTFVITGTAGSSTADPVPANNVASTNTTVVPQADMQAAVSGLPANPAAGSPVTGTAVCTNNGPSPAAAASCVVSGLPAGATTTCTPSPAPNPLPVGQSISCAISFTAPPTDVVNVQAAAGTSTADPVPGNNVAMQPVSVSPVADMAAALAGLPANATAGVPVTGTLTCTNNGPSPAASATCVVGGLPAGASVSCTPSPAPNPLAVGASITCAIGFTPTASGAVTVSGEAGSSTFDPNRANNTVTATTGVIDAVNDTGTLSNGRVAQVAVPNVLANDTLNGGPATLANVTLRQTATSNPNVTLDPVTGAVNVAANTPAGTYTVTYEICTRTTPTVCDTASATVTVGLAPIDAVNDPTFVAGPTGGQVNVLGNDTLAGAPTVADQINITLTANGGLTGLTLDAQGNLIVPPNTAPGSYTATYQICERLNPANCDTATVPIVVQAPIAGSVWFDNGSTPRNREGAESGLPGWTVEAVFPAGSPQAGQIATALNGQPATAVTGANGSYSIPGLAPGNYQLRFRAPGVGGQPGAVYGTPVNGESSNPQPGSTVNTAQRVLDISVPTGGGLTQQSLPVDPSGILYDAVTRQPVTGATVTLLGPNGQPVPANQLLPNQQNQTVIANGPAAGTYRFDLLPTAPAGVYTIRVNPPAGYASPSAVLPPAAPLAFQPGPGIYQVVPSATAPQVGQPTTYHLEINLNPGAGGSDVVHNHIPLDPAVLPQLAIQKTVNVNEAEVGDLVRYTITVRNLSTTTTVPSVNVIDSLPLGFRLIPGTVRGAGVPPVALPNPAGSPGPALTFALGALNAGQQTEFSYYVRLGTAASEGDGTNRAFAQSGNIRSLTAQAKVKVGGGVFRAEACFVGKVYADCGNSVGQGNGNGIQDAGEPGIPGVRLYLEDGTYVISDSEGKYSYCGLKPRTHVLKVDDTTLPPGTRLGTTSNRNAGDPGSLFLDVKKGEVVQADFRDLSCKPSVAAEIERRRSELKKQRNGDVNEAQTEGDQPNGPGLGADRSRNRDNSPKQGGAK